MDMNRTHLATGQPAISYCRSLGLSVRYFDSRQFKVVLEFLYFELLWKYVLEGVLSWVCTQRVFCYTKPVKMNCWNTPLLLVVLWIFLLPGKKAWMSLELVLPSHLPPHPPNHKIKYSIITTLLTSELKNLGQLVLPADSSCSQENVMV